MKPVVIIGGGPAGIAGAVHLAKRGVRTVLIERSARLGGRAASFLYAKMDEEIDYGQHVLMRCCTHSIDLLRLLGQGDSVSFQPSLRVSMRSETRTDEIASRPLPGALHLLPSLLTYRFLSFSERMNAVKAALSLLLRDPDDVSFDEWLRGQGQGKREIATLWEPISVATLNAHAGDASARAARVVFKRGFFKHHGADIGLFTRPLSHVFSSATSYLEGSGGTVLLEAPVSRIIVERGRASGVRLRTGEIIDAHAIISAVSSPDLVSILPPDVVRDKYFSCLKGLNYAPIVNVHLWFDRSIMDEPFIIAVDSRIQAVFDVSATRRDMKRHHIVISQSAATDWIDAQPGEIVDTSLSELKKILPQARKAELIDSLVIKSRSATFIPSPGTDELRPEPTAPISGLFLAGDYTATGWPATIEGAVRSGINAVEALLSTATR